MKKSGNTPPPTDERPERDLLDDPDLIEFTSRLPEARKVSIKVMNAESGNWRHKGSVSVDSFNLDNVQRRFGGGTYQFSIHGADGRLLKTVSNIEIDDLPDDEQPAKTVAPAQTVSGAPISELQLMREQMASDRMLLMKVIDSIGARQAQPQSNITELVTALATLKGMEPKHERPPEVQALMMTSFEKGLELAGKIQGRVSGGEASPMTELIGFARDIFKDAQPLIMDLLKKPAAAKPAAARPAAAIEGGPEMEEPEESDLDLTPALQFIKDRLNDGIPPAALAKMTLTQMDSNPETKEAVSAIVMNQPIEDIVKLDAELMAEPMRTQFGEFFGVLRARISADAPST